MSNRGESEIQSMLNKLETSPDKGLSEVEAYSRLRRFGANELNRPYLRFRYLRLLGLLCLAIAIVLLAKGVLLYAFGAALAGLSLGVAASRYRKHYGQQGAGAFFNESHSICFGIRSGKLRQLYVCDLVPGDIVRIQAGDTVPADGRLLEAVNLAIEEKSFSDRAEPIEKDALQPNDPLASPEASKNRVFMNTMVIRGRGTLVVTETGKNTRIAKVKLTEH